MEQSSIQQSHFGPEMVEFGERLGSGAFGEVYKGECRLYGTKCAIKIITDLQSAHNEKNNIEKLMTLKHDHIVQFFFWMQKEKYGLSDTVYLYMEYCNGGTLKNLLMKKKRTDTDHLVWMLQMASGLEYLHSNKIVHRDLKAENILVNIGNNGECLKLSDFGLSKCFLNEQQQPVWVTPFGHIMCSAPEVVSGKGCDVKADVFSLGCIYYGMLEHCFKVVDGCHYFSAFLYIPEEGDHIPLGKALEKYDTIQIGISTGINLISNELKKLTLAMLKKNAKERMYAYEVIIRLNAIVVQLQKVKEQRKALQGITSTVK